MARSGTTEIDRGLLDGAPDEPEMPFFPDFALREALTAFVLLIVILVVASLTRPPLEATADPTASGVVPRPEWYFLWLFQTLKYFKGGMEVVGTFLLPTVGIGLMYALPFIDRRFRKPKPLIPGTRPVRLWPRLVGASLLLVIGTLTLKGALAKVPMTQQGPTLTAIEAQGQATFDKMGCSSCHSIGGTGGTRGPDLTSFGLQSDAKEKVLLHFSGIGLSPNSVMPGYQLSPEEISALSAYLMSLKGK